MKHLLLTILLIFGVGFQPMPKVTPTTLLNYVAQGKTVVQINASWNKANEYRWVPTSLIKYVEFSLDEFPELKSKFNIQSVPVMLFYNNGKLTERVEGGIAFKITTPQSQLMTTSFN